MFVQIYIPLVVDQCVPNIGFSAIKLLENIGCEVKVPNGQTSCGEELFRKGDWLDAREVATKFIKEFNEQDPIIVPSLESYYFIKYQMEELFDSSSLHLKYKNIQANVYELSQFLSDHLKINNFNAKLEERVAIHPSCSYSISDNFVAHLQDILSNVKGLDIMAELNSCGWKESIYLDGNSGLDLGKLIINKSLEIEADSIVVNDPNCYLHLYNLKEQFNHKDLNIRYFADILISEV